MRKQFAVWITLALVILSLNTALVFATASTSITNATTAKPTIAAVDKDGTSLSNFLNTVNVASNWAKGQYVNWETGATLTNKISPWATDGATHCSGFASAVCAMLNVPLLHPPFPSGTSNGTTYSSLFAATYGVTFPNITATSDSLLANKQGQWLANNAQASIPATVATTASPNNWCHVDAYTAQSYANRGFLALVVYENSNTSASGHIAIIAPYQASVIVGDYPNKSTAYTSLAVDGPYEAQAGGFNSNYTTVSRGFAPPSGSSQQWFGAGSSKNLVKFYVYNMKINWANISIPSGVL